jgi:DNA-binding transcriptional LysR family regulator
MRRPSFTLEQVRSFVAVAETEHVSRAAASLYLTQGAVTQQVRHFERALGVQLLERDGRRVRLTDAGKTVAEACRATLRSIEVLGDTAGAVKELQTGSLHVGASPTSATYYLPPHLAEFTRRHPAVKLEVAVAPSRDLNRRVLTGSLDCAVIESDPEPGLVAVEISPDELILVAHRDHPLSQLKRVTPTHLAQYRYIGRGAGTTSDRFVRQLIGDGYDHLEVLNVEHPEYARAMTVAGLGFAALPKRAVLHDLRLGMLKALPVPPIVRAITAIRRSASGGPALEAFWALLTGGRATASGTISGDGEHAATA